MSEGFVRGSFTRAPSSSPLPRPAVTIPESDWAQQMRNNEKKRVLDDLIEERMRQQRDRFTAPAPAPTAPSFEFPIGPLPAAAAAEPIYHQGINCDCCGSHFMRGTRYKCNVCYNYDLCQGCWANQDWHRHDVAHEFTVIRVPRTAEQNRAALPQGDAWPQ